MRTAKIGLVNDQLDNPRKENGMPLSLHRGEIVRVYDCVNCVLGHSVSSQHKKILTSSDFDETW